MTPKTSFLTLFKRAERTFGKSEIRLAGEGWAEGWQLLVATIMSAQSRDEVTIPIGEQLFSRFPTLTSLANATESAILKEIKSLNYNRSKAKHIHETAQILLKEFQGRVPDSIEALLTLPGVGRKTANLVVSELYNKPGICVDTHVHRLSNVLGWVHTKTPHETELALQKLAPPHLWGKINRILVLWGKTVPGTDKARLLAVLKK